MIPISARNNLFPKFRSNSPHLFCISNRAFSISSIRASLSPKSIEIVKKLYQRDWLLPNEVVDIFRKVDPASIPTLLDHISQRKDYTPNEALYSTIITKLGQVKNFDAIDELLAEIKAEQRCKLSDDFFYNVIKIYGNVGGRINRSMETLFDMPRYGCWPSVKTYNFVLNLLVCTRQFDVIHEVYLRAGELGVEIDACSLNILIKGLCGKGAFEDAHQVLDEFPKQGCKPNERTFSTLMDGLCEKGKVEDAFELLKRMEKEGVWPDTIAFNTLIKGLRKQGRIDSAIELLERMKMRGCNPNSGSLQQVLYGLVEAGRLVEGKDVMGRMIVRGWRPSFDSFKMLFMGLCEEGMVEDADWVLKEMVRHRFVPRMGMWRKALGKLDLDRCDVEVNECVDEIAHPGRPSSEM